MSDNDLDDMIDAAKEHTGINDVIKLHRDYLERVSRNDVILRTRCRKGELVTSSSTY